MGRREKKNYNQLPIECFDELPGPLFQILALYEAEKVQFRKVHRLIDGIEWAVKWHTILTMSDMLREAELTDEIKVLLSSGLRTPSLGTWNHFFRDSMNAIKLPLESWSKLERLKWLEIKYHFVSFRNKYGHGATPSEDECRDDIEIFYPAFLQLIGSKLFTDIKLLISTDKGVIELEGSNREQSDISLKVGHAAARLTSGDILELFPLGICSPIPDVNDKKNWVFYYFNSIKNKMIEQLNYEIPNRFLSVDIFSPFHEALPLKAWSKIGGPELDPFRSRIETLTESFKGRLEERSLLKEFCLNDSGTHMLWGSPGIGKSTLIAQVFKEMRAGITPGGDDQFIKYPPVIEYFIKRGTVYADSTKFLNYLNDKIERVFSLKSIGRSNNENDLWEVIISRLNAIEDLDDNHKLILFIDGLDEFPRITRFIPDSRSWLKVVLSSRRVENIQDWWHGHDREHRSEKTINPMNENNILAMLYNVVNKYQEGFNREYIMEVKKCSEGNPLYLKLLCDQIFERNGLVGNINNLPRGITEIYEKTIKRVSKSGSVKSILSVLRLLTEAKSSLSIEVIASILPEFDSQEIKSAVDGCRELLFEDPLTFEVEDFQLFHESLREWLRKHHKKECKQMAVRITDFCFNWAEIDNDLALQYALSYAAEHLSNQKDHERIWDLMNDDDYRSAQIDFFRNYQVALSSLNIAAHIFADRNGESSEDDVRLCQLVLGTGLLSNKAKTDINEAFEWVKNHPLEDPNPIKDALERLSILDDKNFYKASILLLWLEADRQVNLTVDQRHPEYALMILKEVDHRIPDGCGIVNWGNFFDVEFMTRWMEKILEVFSISGEQMFIRFINHLDDDNKLELIIKSAKRLVRINSELPVIIVRGIVSEVKKYQSITCILAAIIDINSMSGVYPLFKQLIDITETFRDSFCKLQALSAIALALTKVNDFKGNISFFQQCISVIRGIEDDDEFKAYSLEEISSALTEWGNSENTHMLFQKILYAVDTIESAYWSSYALSNIAPYLGCLGEFKKAQNISNTISDEFYLNSYLSQIVFFLTEFEQIEQAKNIVENIEDHYFKSKAISGIAFSLAGKGLNIQSVEYCNKALIETERIADNNDKSWALLDIAKVFAGTGSIDQATSTFQLALSAVESIKYDEDKSTAISRILPAIIETDLNDIKDTLFHKIIMIIEEYECGDEKSMALSFFASELTETSRLNVNNTLFQKLLDATESIEDEMDKSEALSNIVIAISSIDSILDVDMLVLQALSSAETIEDDYDRSNVMSNIAFAFFKAEKYQKALTILDNNIEDKDKSQALSRMAYYCAKVEDLDKKSIMLQNILAVTDTIKSANWQSKSISGVTCALLEAGDIEKALIAFLPALKNIPEHNTEISLVRTLFSLSSAFRKIDNLNINSDILKLIIANVIRCDNDWAKHATIMSVLTALTTADCFEAQEPIFLDILTAIESIEEDDYKYESLSKTASTLAKMDDFEDKCQLFEYIISISDTIASDSQKSEILSSTALAFAQSGYNIKSLDTFRNAILIAIRSDTNWMKFRNLYDITLSLVKIGNDDMAAQTFQQAYHVIDKIIDSYWKSKALSKTISIMCKSIVLENRDSIFNHLLKILMTCEDIYIVEILQKIISAISKSDELMNYNFLYKQIIKLVKTKFPNAGFSSDQRKVEALTGLPIVIADTSDLVETESLFRMLEELVEDRICKPQLLSDIALAYAQVGQETLAKQKYLEALALAESIVINDIKFGVIANIASSMEKAGYSERSHQILLNGLNSVKSIESDLQKSMALDKIGSVITEVIDSEFQYVLLENLLTIVGHLREDINRHQVLLTIVRNNAYKELFGKSPLLLMQALNQVELIDDNSTGSEGLLESTLYFLKSVENDDTRSSILFDVVLSIEEIDVSESQLTLFRRALSIAEKNESDDHRAKMIISIASAMLKAEYGFELINYLDQSFGSNLQMKNIIHGSQELFLEQGPIGMKFLRNSASIFLCDYDFAFKSVYKILEGLIANNQMQTVSEILQQSPQLGFSYLIYKSENTWTYSDFDNWINTIANDDLKEKIEFLAYKVEKGTLDKDAFEENVKELMY